MLIAIVGAAAGLGLLGSVHCALMCGPLFAAGCTPAGARGGVAYLGGRLAMHALGGAVFGALGTHAARTLSGSTAQMVLLGALAAALLGRGVTTMSPRAAKLVPLGRRPRAESRLARLVASLVPRRALPLGLVTGALPCGLLAGGWALAAATASPLHGALVMSVFSFATAPGLVVAVLVGLRAAHLVRRLSPLWQGSLWCALAVFVGLRPILFGVHACCH